MSFEPFMYLAVPLPMAVVMQREVTFVSAALATGGRSAATTFLLQLTQADNIGSLKVELCKILAEDLGEDAQVLPTVDQLVAVEVTGHRIQHTLEDWTLLRHRESSEITVIHRMSTSAADLMSTEEDAAAATAAALAHLPAPLIPTDVAGPIGPMPMPMPSPTHATSSGHGDDGAAASSTEVGAAAAAMLMMDTAVPMQAPLAAPPAQQVVTVTASGDGQASQPQSEEGLVAASEVSTQQVTMAVDTGDGAGVMGSQAGDGSEGPTLPLPPDLQTATSSAIPMPPPVEDMSCVICMEDFPPSEVQL